MFDASSLQGFVNTLTVNTAAMNAEQAKALLVKTAIGARDRVMSGTPRPTSYRQIVDGKTGSALTSVKPDGVIVFAWQYLREVVADTRDALINRSPALTGTYRAGILVLVDGHETDVAAIGPKTQEVYVVASVPYSRRLEVGKTKSGRSWVIQVKPRIVEETAIVARRLWGDLASFEFQYIELSDAYRLRRTSSHRRSRGKMITDVRYPAIKIQARTA